ncbi:MAG: helix-turn-helix transcriptional regulator [Clostridia bacterium]|nr:helix-turn-helix transcriptional regulator [Clostridia bacterium]
MGNIVLPDIVAVGIYNAQIALKNKQISPNRKTTMFEIELPIEDGGTSYMDEDSHAISNNIVICAKPGQIRHTRLPFRCYYIHIILNEGQLFDILSAFPNYIELEESKEIKELFISICEHYQTGTSKADVMLQSQILKLIYILDQKFSASTMTYVPKPNNQKVIEQTLAYIKENLTAELSLDLLAKRASFSPIYFHKLFKASTGKTLREYIEEQRIKKAVDLLTATGKTLTQIAYECGFSSQSYFSYAFKRKMKMPPREYAKEVQLKYEK